MEHNEIIEELAKELGRKMSRSTALNLMVCNVLQEVDNCREDMLYHATMFYKNLLELRDGKEHEIEFTKGIKEKAKLLHSIEDDEEIAIIMYCMGHLHGRCEEKYNLRKEANHEDDSEGSVSSTD